MNIEILPGEKTGQTLLRLGVLKERHLNNILIRQQHGDTRKFGQIAVALRYLKPEIMSGYLRAFNRIIYTLDTAPENRNRKKTGTAQSGNSGHTARTVRSFR